MEMNRNGNVSKFFIIEELPNNLEKLFEIIPRKVKENH